MTKNKLKKIGIVLLFLFIASCVAKYYIDKIALENDHRYCIGYIYRWEAMSNQGASLYYEFYFDGKKYDSDQTTYDKVRNFMNKRFFVEFSPKNPKNNRILLDKPIIDTLLIQPLEGWASIPY